MELLKRGGSEKSGVAPIASMSPAVVCLILLTHGENCRKGNLEGDASYDRGMKPILSDVLAQGAGAPHVIQT